MVICPRCQAQNPDGVVQCGRCGYPLQYSRANNPNMPSFQPANPTFTRENQEQKKPALRNKKKTDITKIILIIICFLLLISNVLFIMLYLRARSENKDSSTSTNQYENMVDQFVTTVIPETYDEVFNGSGNDDYRNNLQYVEFNKKFILPGICEMTFTDFGWEEYTGKRTGLVDFVVNCNVKNINKQSIDLDKSSIEITFNDSYTYDDPAVHSEQSRYGQGDVEPLLESKVSFIFHVSKEIQQNFDQAELVIGYNDFVESVWNKTMNKWDNHLGIEIK